MPDYKFHIIFGLIFAGFISYLLYKYGLLYRYDILSFSKQDFIFIIPILFIYAILPDIDISSSKISKLFRIIGFIIILSALFFDMTIPAIILCIILLILEFISHRKFIHTITAAVIFSLPLIYFNYIIALFAFLGYLSHLLIDGEVKMI